MSDSDPLLIRTAGGLTQLVPAAKLKAKSGLGQRSLMMSAAQLGLTAQETAIWRRICAGGDQTRQCRRGPEVLVRPAGFDAETNPWSASPAGARKVISMAVRRGS